MVYSNNAPSLGLKTGMELRFLLLLLLFYISGFQAQEHEAVESRVEGQSLSVECHYDDWRYSKIRKTWCQVSGEICSALVSTSYTSTRSYRNKGTSRRATIQDDTWNGIVTITMKMLQVQDSGVYWCARYDRSNTLYPLKTIKLDVSKAPTTSDVPVTRSTGHTSPVLSTASAGLSPRNSSSVESRSTFLWLGVGLLINKTLLAVIIALQVRRIRTPQRKHPDTNKS